MPAVRLVGQAPGSSRSSIAARAAASTGCSGRTPAGACAALEPAGSALSRCCSSTATSARNVPNGNGGTQTGSSAHAVGNAGSCGQRPVDAGRARIRAGHRIPTPPASTAGGSPGSPASTGAGPAGNARRTGSSSARPISPRHWMIHPTGSASSPPTWSAVTIPAAPAPCSPDSAST